MHYDSVLSFVRKILANSYIPTVRYEEPSPEKKQFFIAGPFTFVDINKKNYLGLLEKLESPSNLLPLLNAANLQIQTISFSCGFHDINYFTRIFK